MSEKALHPGVQRLFRGGGSLRPEPEAPSAPTRPLRVAAYCRVSTDSEAQETSLETQRRYFERLIQAHPGWELVQIYADQGVTGTLSMKRPAFRRMIEDALAGRIDYILIKSISRFSRNTVDCLQYARLLREKGVFIRFEKENIDTGSAYSEMLLTVLAAFAQEESIAISENLAWACRKRFEAGVPRRFSLFGYRAEPGGEYRIVPEEARIVREAFRLYERGDTLAQIARAFAARGWKTASGAAWSPSSLCRMLDNEKYVGDVMMQKRVTIDPLSHRAVKNDQTVHPSYYLRDHHPAIVDRAQYNRVRRIRTLRNQALGPSQYPYADYLECPLCGERLIQRRCEVLRQQSAWRCERGDRSCGRYVVAAELIDRAVLTALRRLDMQALCALYNRLQAPENAERLTAAARLIRLKRRQLSLRRVDYAWVEDTMDKIAFTPENQLVVHWRCGLQSAAPLALRHHRDDPLYAAQVCRQRAAEGTLPRLGRHAVPLPDRNPIPILPEREGRPSV